MRLHCVLGEIQLRGEWFGQLIRNYNFKLFIVWFIYTPPIFGWLSPTIADYPGQGFVHFVWLVSQTIFCCLVLSYSHCSPNRSLPSFTFGKSYLEPVRNVGMSSRHWSVASYSKLYTYSWLYSFSQNLSCVLLVSLIPKFITPNAALRIRRHCALIGLRLHKMLALNKLKLKVKLRAFRCPCLCLFVILPPIPLKSS